MLCWKNMDDGICGLPWCQSGQPHTHGRDTATHTSRTTSSFFFFSSSSAFLTASSFRRSSFRPIMRLTWQRVSIGDIEGSEMEVTCRREFSCPFGDAHRVDFLVKGVRNANEKPESSE